MVNRSRPGKRVVADARGTLRIVRALRAHEHSTAAGLIALLVLAYLSPALLGGKVLAANTFLSVSPPWAAAGAPRSFNPEHADAAMLYYPWDLLARQLLHAGVFPAWNPYALAGTPLFANPQIAWLSPFQLPLWLLPFHYGLGFAAALRLWTAGFGTYLLVRELRLGFWPALVAAVGYTLCAFNVIFLENGVFVSVSALLPWALWLVERIGREARGADGLALAAVVAGIQTGGHPGTQVHVLGATVLYAVVRGATRAGPPAAARVRGAGLVAVAVVVGTLVAAVVLLPAQETSRETLGATLRANGGNAIFPGSSMPFGVIRTVLFPDWWGRLADIPANLPRAAYRERTLYAGSAALVLALVALASSGAWRRKAPFALLGAVGLAVVLRAPLIRPLVVHLPFFDRVQNQRMALWLELAVCVLAAFATRDLLDGAISWRRVWTVVGSVVAMTAIALSSLKLSGRVLAEARHVFFDRSLEASPSALAAASVAWSIVFVAGLVAVLAMAWRAPRMRAGAGVLIALVVALDAFHFGHGYQSFRPASAVLPKHAPAIGFVQRHVGDGRIAAIAPAFPEDSPTDYGLRDVRGADPPFPTERFHRLWQLMGGIQPWAVEALFPNSPKVLGLLGARYIMTGPEAVTRVPGTRVAYRGPDAIVYANARAVPRAFVPARVEVAEDEEAELATLADPTFDARHDAVVRRDELRGVAAADLARPAGTVRVVTERNAEVVLLAAMRRPGVVVLDDQIAPGWRVRVDGRPRRALRADVVLRGVAVPAGRHRIVWSYDVPGLRAGALLSGIGVLTMLAWGGWLLTLRRRAARSRGARARRARPRRR
jgi:hypothetical protein